MAGKLIHEMDAEERDAFSEAVAAAKSAYEYNSDQPWQECRVNWLMIALGRELLKRKQSN